MNYQSAGGKLILWAATAVTAAVLCCPSAQAQGAACQEFSASVTATIATEGGVVKVTPERACLTPGGKMNWTAGDGETWATDFGDDAKSPFGRGLARHSGRAKATSGHPVRSCTTSDANFDAAAGGCVFKYSAEHVKGGKKAVVDPDVIIRAK